MTLEEAKGLKQGQKCYYKSSYTYLPDKVEVFALLYDNNGKLQVHLTDDSYVPERDLDNLFINKEECIKSCEKDMQKRIETLRQMLLIEKSK